MRLLLIATATLFTPVVTAGSALAQVQNFSYGIDRWSAQPSCSCDYQAWGGDPRNSVTLAKGETNDHGKLTTMLVNTGGCGSGVTHAENTITFTDKAVPVGSLVHSVGVYFFGSGNGDNSWTCTVKAWLNGVEVTHYDIGGYDSCPTQHCLGFGYSSIPSDYPNGLDFFHPGASNTLKITVDVYQPQNTYCGRAGVDIDMVQIFGSYEAPPSIKTVSFATVQPDQYGIFGDSNTSGALMFIPERPDTVPAASAPQYQILKIVADTSLAAGTAVWFRCYDPDDPTASASPIDPNDDSQANAPSDNIDGPGNTVPATGHPIGELARLGSTADPAATNLNTVQASVQKVGSGPSAKYQAVAYVRVPMQPGDNILVAASTNKTELDSLALNGQHLKRTNGLGLPSTASNESKVLFTWRQLRLNLTSMSVVNGNRQNGKIGAATLDTSNQSAPRLDLWIVPSGMPNDAYDYYSAWQVNSYVDKIYVEYDINGQTGVLAARFRFFIDNPADPPADQPTGLYLVVDDFSAVANNYQLLANTSAIINDDDDFGCIQPSCVDGSSPGNTSANEGQLVPVADLTLLPNVTSSGNFLARAFVIPITGYYDPSLQYQQNITDDEVLHLKQSWDPSGENVNSYWVLNLVTVFQGPSEQDNDGEGDAGPMQKTAVGNAPDIAVVRVENIHEIGIAPAARPDIISVFYGPVPITPASGAALAATALAFGADPTQDECVRMFVDPAMATVPAASALMLSDATVATIRRTTRIQ